MESSVPVEVGEFLGTTVKLHKCPVFHCVIFYKVQIRKHDDFFFLSWRQVVVSGHLVHNYIYTNTLSNFPEVNKKKKKIRKNKS